MSSPSDLGPSTLDEVAERFVTAITAMTLVGTAAELEVQIPLRSASVNILFSAVR
jgi:hypothetical protein